MVAPRGSSEDTGKQKAGALGEEDREDGQGTHEDKNSQVKSTEDVVNRELIIKNTDDEPTGSVCANSVPEAMLGIQLRTSHSSLSRATKNDCDEGDSNVHEI